MGHMDSHVWVSGRDDYYIIKNHKLISIAIIVSNSVEVRIFTLDLIHNQDIRN